MPDTLILAKPAAEHEAAVLDYIAEHKAAGETHLSGGLGDFEDFASWQTRCDREHAGLWQDPEWNVPSSIFLAIRERDQRLVGLVRLRLGDSPKVIDFDGHIGCGIRPSERRKGYALALLHMGVRACGRAGMARVLVTCDHDNAASEALLRGAGGVFEDSRYEPDGNLIHRFWFAAEAHQSQ